MTDAFELLKGWPGWAKANAERVLASPAWRMAVECDGETADVTAAQDEVRDFLWLDVAFDDERHLLGVADSTVFPELHLIWAKRGGLPAEVLLALAERECGSLFQLLENATGRTFALKGVADAAAADGAKVRTFAARKQGADNSGLVFGLDMSPTLNLAFGQLKYLDTNHPAIREMEIDAEAEYVRFELAESDVADLAVGDFLLCGEASAAKWRYGSAPAQGVRAVGVQAGRLTFGQIADGALPSVPEPELVRIVCGEDALAEGVFDRLVGKPAVRIVRTGIQEG